MSTYHDWATQTTEALKLERLNLHISEVGAQLGSPDVAADGKSIDRNALNAYYKTLISERDKLLAAGVGAVGGGFVLSRRRP